MTAPSGDVARTVVPLRPPGRSLLVVEPFPGGEVPSRRCLLLCSGLGGAWFDWLPLARELSGRCRVLIVDRPGVGDAPRWDAGTDDLATAAHDLIAALDSCRVDRAVLVGHSMGAWYVEAAARLHPDRVEGVVLVDGSVARVSVDGGVASGSARCGGIRRFVADATVHTLDRIARLSVGWDRLGPALRTAAEGPGPGDADLAGHRDRVRVAYARPEVWRAAAREWAAYPSLAREVAGLRSTRPLPEDVPVVVVTAETRLPPSAVAPWTRVQERQRRALSGTGGRVADRLVVVRPAPHMLMLTHPRELARVVTELPPRVATTCDPDLRTP